ncbi:MAG: methyltransferase domain-containing protein [Caulobacteraceae bacterium]|nr:methyltransferase domain-containing protein [Caulobacteraceae bacterium]
MPQGAGPNADQVAHWNGPAAATWVAIQARLDRQIEPIGRATMDALAPGVGDRVLDIGCGCGASTLELSRRVGAAGEALGIDPSGPMLDVARRRATEAGLAQARFLEADAQTHAFAPASFDKAYSRFGVMFFADPVAAFANVRRALKPEGRIAFLCWRTPAENPIMSLPMAAARPHLPAPASPPDPGAPGPFAFADRSRIETILARAGFADIGVVAHDEKLTAGPLDEAVDTALRMGPLGSFLREHPEFKAAVEPAVRIALAQHQSPRGVFLDSATWIVTARNSTV